jgi:16S rRNA (adenine1518-N6/adenine1519-N6)-dimethyltransferase
MDLTSKKDILALLDQYQARPRKSLGQNFLINLKILEKMISFVSFNDTILEVGPGLGALTKKLTEKANKVIAIEKDPVLAEILRKNMSSRIEVITGDVLKEEISLKNYSLVANLPYYVSTAVIRKFLESENPPQEIIVTVQKEVAQRISAKPPRMSLLSVSIQFYAETQILFSISSNCFWPKPNVDSAVIKIIPKKKLPEINPDLFFKVVKAGFSRPRAQLLNNISKKLLLDKEETIEILQDSGINPKQRAETLKVEDWVKLSEKIKA